MKEFLKRLRCKLFGHDWQEAVRVSYYSYRIDKCRRCGVERYV